MAFKLNKTEEAARSSLVESLTARRRLIEAAALSYNKKMGEAWVEVASAIEDYNKILSDIREFCEGIVTARRGEWYGMSERWQEGDRGRNAGAWVEEWGGVYFEDVDVARPYDWAFPDCDHDEALGELPGEAE